MEQMKQIKKGVVRVLPICLGVFPTGITFGIVAMQAGLSVLEATAMSFFVVAGASQFMAVNLLVQAASLPSIWITVFLVNLRHLIMSTYVMNALKEESFGKRFLASLLIVDESFAVFSIAEKKDQNGAFMTGVGITLFLTWVGSTFLGCIAASIMPPILSKSLSIVFYAAFIRILITSINGRKSLWATAIFAMVCNQVGQLFLPQGVSIMIAMLAGAAFGTYLTEKEDENHA